MANPDRYCATIKECLRATLLSHIVAHPTDTFPQIALALGWSHKVTLAKLWAAHDEGLIQVHNNGGKRREDRTYSIEPVKVHQVGNGKVEHPERIAGRPYRLQIALEKAGLA